MIPSLWPVFFVAVGGAIGAGLRFLLSSFVAHTWESYFPLGTLLVNVLGCLLIGFLVARGLDSSVWSNWRLFLVVGMGGAFTTFSSFSLETLNLMNDGLYGFALLNVASNLFLCLLAAWLGTVLARL